MKDNAIFAEALAMVDKYVFDNPELSHFADHPYDSFIKSYLQLFFNPEEEEIYSDINMFAASARGFMPIEKNLNFNLYNDSEISLTSSAWGWWAKLAERLDYGKFKTIIRKKFGKENEYFAHYFARRDQNV